MDKRLRLSTLLKTKNPKQLNMVLGFDGFVDEIIHVVDKRVDPLSFTRIETIKELGERIVRASGLSTNIELVPTVEKIGGNGPIMCNALSQHESKITYLGALGFPTINNVFKEMEERVTLHSFAVNGHTDALEFDDGKLMLGKMQSLNDVNYENLVQTYGKDRFVSLLSTANLFANVNWSMLPNLTLLWKKMIQEILPLLPNTDKKPYFFVDLADPEKRENDEIIDALTTLKGFRSKFHVVLGLNKKEAYDIADVYGLFPSSDLSAMSVSLEEVNRSLYNELDLDCVVIHPRDRSSCVIDGTYYMELGPFVKKPKLSTGAGDNFNAGFMLGMLLGLSPDSALLTGMSTSGYYVRQAKSPTYEELQTFLIDWANDNL